MAISANIKNTKPKAATYIIKNPVKMATDPDYEWFETEDGTKIQGKIQLVGRNSKQFKDYIKKISDNSETLDYKKVIAELIIGWEDTGFFDAPFSAEKVQELITDPNDDWLVEQLVTFSVDNSNFF